MKSESYWKQRALRLEEDSQREADRTVSKVLAAYDRAEEQINRVMETLIS